MRDLALGVVIGFLVAWTYTMLWKVRYAASLRSDAVVRSQAITAGKVQEQLLPYFPDFPYNPKDVRFLGSPTDLIVFDGLASGEVKRVVFLEVKTGGSCLTARERSVREAAAWAGAAPAGDAKGVQIFNSWLSVRWFVGPA